ncbi:unnamed protein product [Ilex paraguariensis]|uniref:Chalcone-flavonone isomerase family protein n=1 Tax=Ilex paraguariensis TaxID=185542 RepID=A0ABC8SW97_9AQUA
MAVTKLLLHISLSSSSADGGGDDSALPTDTSGSAIVIAIFFDGTKLRTLSFAGKGSEVSYLLANAWTSKISTRMKKAKTS